MPTTYYGHPITAYSGPYERWVFTPELGEPFAFPAIRNRPETPFFAALLDGAGSPPLTDELECRTPPLWVRSGTDPYDIIPFVFRDKRTDTSAPLGDMLTLMAQATPERPPRFRINFPMPPSTWTPQYDPNQTPAKWIAPQSAPKAIIAVIDDGIPFAHRAFLKGDGKSRISHLWVQAAGADQTAAVPFGREITNGAIDDWRALYGDDELRLYRAAQVIAPSQPELGQSLLRRATHGGHIAGIAAGNDACFGDMALGDDIAIIAVQLPNTIAWDTSGFGKDMYMLSALHYVCHRARAIAAHFTPTGQPVVELPLVVNFSYGWSASRHDGQSEMALAMDQLIGARKLDQPKTALVMPTGNTFESKMHGQICATDFQNKSFSFGWHLPPDDRTSSYLEIWLPTGVAADEFSVKITPPNGHSLSSPDQISFIPDPDLAGQADPARYVELTIDGHIVGQLSVDNHRGSRWRCLVAFIPTVYVGSQDRRLPAGLWTIEIQCQSTPDLGTEGAINIWVQRDDDPTELQTGGRQSRLVDLNPISRTVDNPLTQYDDPLGMVRGYGAINGVATGQHVTRVAGYCDTTKRPSRYSGAGGLQKTGSPPPAPFPWGPQPFLSANSEDSLWHSGAKSIGTLSGSCARLVGTSVAAPAAARWMVSNAANGLDLIDGLAGPLPLPPIEAPTPTAQARHSARVGVQTVPRFGKPI